MASITYTKGDATKPIGVGNKLIVHICNDIGAWGKGFVMALSKKWKEPEQKYREWHKTMKNFELGQIQQVKVEPLISVINMIGQHNIRRTKESVPIRYSAVEECLEKVSVLALDIDASIHMPRIGCGLAGGTWELIEPIIERTLVDKLIEVTVYDFE